MPAEARLVRNLVLVQEAPRDEQRESGLYVPDAGEEPPDLTWGEVLAVGPDCRELQLGDRVLYHRFMGTEVLWGEDRVPALALREQEIFLKELEPGRYRLDCIAPEVPGGGIYADLEEAGRAYLAGTGHWDIYDTKLKRYVNPELEVPCVADAYAEWHARQQEDDGVEYVGPKWERGSEAALAAIRDEVDAETDPLG